MSQDIELNEGSAFQPNRFGRYRRRDDNAVAASTKRGVALRQIERIEESLKLKKEFEIS